MWQIDVLLTVHVSRSPKTTGLDFKNVVVDHCLYTPSVADLCPNTPSVADLGPNTRRSRFHPGIYSRRQTSEITPTSQPFELLSGC